MTKIAKKKGIKYAITAWEWKRPGVDSFSGNIPKDSNDYSSWFQHISNSAGYCLEIDGEWIKIQFMHLATPIWLHSAKLEICE